jgi:preprotein translocase subunit YajC
MPAGDFAIQSLIVLGVMLLGYALLIRPQIKRTREHEKMLAALDVGDQVALSGGLIGRVTQINSDQIIEIELSNSMQVKVLRSAVDSIIR